MITLDLASMLKPAGRFSSSRSSAKSVTSPGFSVHRTRKGSSPQPTRMRSSAAAAQDGTGLMGPISTSCEGTPQALVGCSAGGYLRAANTIRPRGTVSTPRRVPDSLDLPSLHASLRHAAEHGNEGRKGTSPRHRSRPLLTRELPLGSTTATSVLERIRSSPSNAGRGEEDSGPLPSEWWAIRRIPGHDQTPPISLPRTAETFTTRPIPSRYP